VLEAVLIVEELEIVGEERHQRVEVVGVEGGREAIVELLDLPGEGLVGRCRGARSARRLGAPRIGGKGEDDHEDQTCGRGGCTSVHAVTTRGPNGWVCFLPRPEGGR